jgi:putative transposase
MLECPPLPLAAWPVRRPPNWLEIVNQPLDEARLADARHCVKRGCPHGDAPWVAQTAADLSLEQTLRPRGRPRKSASEHGK